MSLDAAEKGHGQHTVFAGEQRLADKHLRKDTSYAPNVHGLVVVLPGQHDLRCTVVSRGDVAGHLHVRDTRETEIANLSHTPPTIAA